MTDSEILALTGVVMPITAVLAGLSFGVRWWVNRKRNARAASSVVVGGFWLYFAVMLIYFGSLSIPFVQQLVILRIFVIFLALVVLANNFFECLRVREVG